MNPGGPAHRSALARVPKAVLLAWGAAPAPTKGPRPRWTVEQLLDAAVRLGDDHGIDAVTMSGLANALGSGTMSLYRYVESREDLVVLAADRALGAPAAPSGGTWRERTRNWVLDLRAVYERHPWLTSIPVGTEPLLPSYARRLEAGLACLEPLGLPGERAITVLTLLWTYTRGDAEQAAQLAALASDASGDDLNTMLSARLRALSNGEGLSRLLAVLDQGAQPAEPSAEHETDEFIAAVDLILGGIEADLA